MSPYTPYIFCDARQPPDTYTGYYVELFRALAQRLDWLSDFDSWFFDCVSCALDTPCTSAGWRSVGLADRRPACLVGDGQGMRVNSDPQQRG